MKMAKVIRFPIEKIIEKKIIHLRLDQMIQPNKKGLVVKDDTLKQALKIIADKSIPLEQALEMIQKVYMTH